MPGSHAYSFFSAWHESDISATTTPHSYRKYQGCCCSCKQGSPRLLLGHALLALQVLLVLFDVLFIATVSIMKVLKIKLWRIPGEVDMVHEGPLKCGCGRKLIDVPVMCSGTGTHLPGSYLAGVRVTRRGAASLTRCSSASQSDPLGWIACLEVSWDTQPEATAYLQTSHSHWAPHGAKIETHQTATSPVNTRTL